MPKFPGIAAPVLLILSIWPSGAATVHADFEGGSIGRVEQLSPSHFRLAVKGETDQNGRNRQASWYYFRVDDAPLSELIFDLVGLPGEYNFKPNQGAITGDTPPVISFDRKTWTHLTGCEYDSKEPRLRLRVHPQAARFWIAHTPPYTNEDLATLRQDARKHPDFREEIVGTTPGGRPLYLWTIQTGAPARTVWLMVRQHSWESGTSWVGEGAVRALLDDGGQKLRREAAWKIVPMCDPDGVARGGVRFNARGYDLNRNWDVDDSRSMPEITAERSAIAQWLKSGHRIDLFLTLHNTETAEYLEAPPAAAGPVHDLGEAFFRALVEKTTFDPSRPLSYASETTTEGMKGRMTVNQGLWHDFRIPAFLMEQRISFNRKLGHLPEIPDRLNFGRELVFAIASAVAKPSTQ